MNFKAKIFLVTLSILIITLVLNSVLSILSFESNYVDSLISTYEMAGNTLKRKIEQSLNFGKPLDKFQGMEKLFQKTASKNEHISRIWIEGKDGEVLYEFKKEGAGPRPSVDFKKKKVANVASTKTILLRDNYLTIIPLKSGTDKIVGRLYLALPEKVILAKMENMVISNLNILWPVVLITSFCLVFFLAILIFKPLRKDFSAISGLFEWQGYRGSGKGNEREQKKLPEKESDSENVIVQRSQGEYIANISMERIKNEIEMLKTQIGYFVEEYTHIVQDIDNFKNEHQAFLEIADELMHKEAQIEEEMQSLRASANHSEIYALQVIIEENRHLRETITLFCQFVQEMEEVCNQKAFTQF